jgi:hypothetical protein
MADHVHRTSTSSYGEALADADSVAPFRKAHKALDLAEQCSGSVAYN